MKRLLTLRSLCCIAIGALLCAFLDSMASVLVTAIGILFLLSGLVSTLAYVRSRSTGEPLRFLYPIIGIGSALFGILLCILSRPLARYICYLLSAFLILSSLIELIGILRLRSRTRVESFFWLIPCLVTLACVSVFVLPQSWLAPTLSGDEAVLAAQASRLSITGVACIVYGIFVLVSSIRFRRVQKVQSESPATPTPGASSSTPTPSEDKEDHSRFTPSSSDSADDSASFSG